MLILCSVVFNQVAISIKAVQKIVNAYWLSNKPVSLEIFNIDIENNNNRNYQLFMLCIAIRTVDVLTTLI